MVQILSCRIFLSSAVSALKNRDRAMLSGFFEFDVLLQETPSAVRASGGALRDEPLVVEASPTDVPTGLIPMTGLCICLSRCRSLRLCTCARTGMCGCVVNLLFVLTAQVGNLFVGQSLGGIAIPDVEAYVLHVWVLWTRWDISAPFLDLIWESYSVTPPGNQQRKAWGPPRK